MEIPGSFTDDREETYSARSEPIWTRDPFSSQAPINSQHGTRSQPASTADLQSKYGAQRNCLTPDACSGSDNRTVKFAPGTKEDDQPFNRKASKTYDSSTSGEERRERWRQLDPASLEGPDPEWWLWKGHSSSKEHCTFSSGTSGMPKVTGTALSRASQEGADGAGPHLSKDYHEQPKTRRYKSMNEGEEMPLEQSSGLSTPSQVEDDDIGTSNLYTRESRHRLSRARGRKFQAEKEED